MTYSADILKLSEKDWQTTCIDLLHVYGYKVAHFRGAWSQDGKRFTTPVQADGKGFPDLFASLPRSPGHPLGRVLLIECKTDNGKLSPAQEEWRRLLEECLGIEYYLARPRDYDRLVEEWK